MAYANSKDSDPHAHCPAKLYAVCSWITKTCLIKYTENFTTKKWKFSDKNLDFFLISAQNIDCGYSLEQSMFWAEIRKLMYTPVNPSFTI